ncbi:hypothetical protein [Paenibacillus naphthalenovorans]|uniref:hypothetical protein n=1 Tax=Paenibacillus naphthalenovorans TaxID=162209 RepID=UPI003D2A1924
MKLNGERKLDIFLKQVEENVCDYLEKQKDRFPSYQRLVNKFRSRYTFWSEISTMTNEIIEIVNELCIAKFFLEESTNPCKRLEYEPKHESTDQSIDFSLELQNNTRKIYCDVKTIHPDFINDWDKFERAVKHKFIPDNITVHIDKDSGGGEYWHHWTAARTKMLDHIIAFEKKILIMGLNEEINVMLFCGNGFQLRLDLLEDFADRYKVGRYRHDDIFSKMERHHMESNEITFLNNVDYIAYAERHDYEITIRKFVGSVQGPRN